MRRTKYIAAPTTAPYSLAGEGIAAAVFQAVMRRLDPRIHRFRKNGFFKQRIAGSSPAMKISKPGALP
jgi:hypothetical protein